MSKQKIEVTGPTGDDGRRKVIEAAQQPLLAIYDDLEAAFALIAEAVLWWRAGTISTEQAMEAVAATVDAHVRQEAGE